MENTYKISIITVCYNSEKTIERCLNSVIEQLTEDVEYIIIDGKSKDRTFEIIQKKCQGLKDIYCYSEPDDGIYDAMNKGIARSRGKYIYFLNSDDALQPNVIPSILAEIKINQDYDCIYGNCEVVEFDENGDGKHIKIWYGDQDVSNLRKTMICSHQAIICKRDALLQAGGFYLKLKIAADWDLLLRLYRNQASYKYVDITFAKFSRGGVSCSKNHEWERHLVRKRNGCYKWIDREYLKYIKTMVYDKVHEKKME